MNKKMLIIIDINSLERGVKSVIYSHPVNIDTLPKVVDDYFADMESRVAEEDYEYTEEDVDNVIYWLEEKGYYDLGNKKYIGDIRFELV